MKEVSIQFLGATGTVTGSKYLLKTPEGNFLIDCGLFQGLKELRLRNREPFQFDPRHIKGLLLTHAHLDHCGAIPLLVKNGFQRKIYCSAPTKDLTRLILLDSAKIQEEEAHYANLNQWTKHKPALPLYTQKDVFNSLPYFNICDEKEWIHYSKNIKFRFISNGHILGSCLIEIHCYGKIIVFSGDMGRYSSPILYPPSDITEVDYLILESTYGNKLHDDVPGEETLGEVINDTMRKKGNLLISSFAIGRIQELIFMIYKLKKSHKIQGIPVYIDTPMGIDAMEVFIRYAEWHKLTPEECKKMMEDIVLIKEYNETEVVLGFPGVKIVIAASGMLTGGRVLCYLKEYISFRKNTILLTGYQAAGTRGRALKEGAHEIKIDGQYYKVQAEIREISSLSAHADQQELLRWYGGIIRKPKAIFLVHGEPTALDAFRLKLESETNARIIIPKETQEFYIN
jgi:metallo-beta-lactamase family protein